MLYPAGMSKRDAWNARYGSVDLVWGIEPNRFLEEALRDVEPHGRILDLACGEGRNTIWLAQRGWRATGVDFSRVAIERARKLAEQRDVEVEFIEADVTTWTPDPSAYALVVVLYLHVPPPERRRVWAHIAAGLEPGGEFLLVGHALRNLAEGVGGPQDPEVLWDPDEIVAELEAVGMDVLGAEHVARSVEDSDTDAVDVRISGRK